MKNYCRIIVFAMISSYIILVGEDSTPTMSRIYGNQYDQAVPDTQQAGIVGQLVPTGIFGVNGSLSLAMQVPNAQAVAVQALPNGIIAVVFNDGTNGYMVEYTLGGYVNQDFAVGTGNILELVGLANASLSLLVDKQNRFIVSGSDDTHGYPWIVRVTSQGTIDSTFTFTDGSSWANSGSITKLGMQSSGKIIAVGFNGTNGMLARYNLDGSIDVSFGANGYSIFNGISSLPTSTNILNNIFVDADDNIYCAYINGTNNVQVIRLTSAGLVDTLWNSGAPVSIDYVNGTGLIANQLCMAINLAGDLIIAAPSGSPTIIKAASIQASSGAAGSFANFSTSGGVFGSDAYSLFDIISSSDGNVYFTGSNTTQKQMAIISLTSDGSLNTDFNPLSTPGVNFFYPAGTVPSEYAQAQSSSTAPTGQILLAGSQLSGATQTPYLSCLYNTQYIFQIIQNPLVKEQGTFDTTFGLDAATIYDGVVSPFIGSYRMQLEQKAANIIELASGNILIGMSGFTNNTNQSSMMLVSLTSNGYLDTSFGSGSGMLVLPNLTDSNEVLTSVLQDPVGDLYVSGYSDLGAIIRKYQSNGTLIWNSDYLESGFSANSFALQGATRLIVSLSGPSNTGQINAYTEDDGVLDIKFHNNGIIPSSAYNLHLGPILNACISNNGTVLVAYVNSQTTNVDATAFLADGSNVLWTKNNIFASYPSIQPNNVGVSFNQDRNLAIAASVDNNFLLTIVSAQTGNPTTAYPQPLAILAGSDMQFKQCMGITDGSLILIGFDNSSKTMIMTRVTPTGIVDTTFNSQGTDPGILSFIISDQINDYYARILSSVAVQSYAGANQGNLVIAAYEQIFASQSMPAAMRVFGQPGTMQVINYPPESVSIPGMLDPTYNATGIAPTYALGADSPTANQQARAILPLIGTQLMTLITDENSSISYLLRLNSDSQIDTSFGEGLGIPVVKINGTELVTNVNFDGMGNFLITGSNSNAGGFLKRVLLDGSMNNLFGGSTNPSSPQIYPLGTIYGVMDVINDCQELTNGNVVLVGNKNGIGTIQMINAQGTLLSSFGTNGQVTMGVNAASVSVDSSNNIYVAIAYIDSNSNLQAGILKLDATGQPVTSFGNNGFVASMLSLLDNSDSLRSGFDAQGNLLIAGSFGNASGQVSVNRYTAAGVQDQTFNNGQQLDISFATSTQVFVTAISMLTNGKVLVAGYQLDPNDITLNDEFVICLDSSGQLDISFGGGSIPGISVFQGLNTPQIFRVLADMNIQFNGGIVLAGGESPAVNEQTPMTFRLIGYDDGQAIPQFTGYGTTDLPVVLNLGFNSTGISDATLVSNLVQVGNIATDILGNVLIGGVTNDGLLVVARFLSNGLLDTVEHGGTGFGTDGIAKSSTPITGLTGGRVSIDDVGRVYVAGQSGSGQLIVARFTAAGVLDTDNFGIQGIAASIAIAGLQNGGFVKITQASKIVVAGYTGSGTVVATQFLQNGSTDPNFAPTTSYVATIAVPDLITGGSVVADSDNHIYIGIRTTAGLGAVKVSPTGNLDTSFGTDGIVQTNITNLSEGSDIAINSSQDLFVGGLITNQQFVVTSWTSDGVVNTQFNTSGIAYSYPVNGLDTFGNIAVDGQNNVIVGGSSIDQSLRSLIVARFTSLGVLDTQFSRNGMATTGIIHDLSSNSGFVATDYLYNIFIGGFLTSYGFIIAENYSGYEINVTEPRSLTYTNKQIYFYGNTSSFLADILAVPFYAQTISNVTIRQAVIDAINVYLFDSYVPLHINVPGWNLVWNLYLQSSELDQVRAGLVLSYPAFEDEINTCFDNLNNRINDVKYAI
ncbi:MAG: hypothetical protein ACXWL5_02860 [Candidatus Chromulinivorax sp.]